MRVVRGGTLPTPLRVSKYRYTSPGFLAMIVGGACRFAFRRVHTWEHLSQHVERSPAYVLSTLPDPTTNVGLELLGTLRKEPFSVTATYTSVRARETVDAIEHDVQADTASQRRNCRDVEGGGRRRGSGSSGITPGARALRKIRIEPSASRT